MSCMTGIDIIEFLRCSLECGSASAYQGEPTGGPPQGRGHACGRSALSAGSDVTASRRMTGEDHLRDQPV